MADLALTPEAVEALDEIAAELAARRVRDRLFALWVDRAPRFGAVAVHFPRSLRAQRFVASFWAPEVFFSWPSDGMPLLGWYRTGGMTRGLLDETHALQVEHGCKGPTRFWSPELPEVRVRPALSGSPWKREVVAWVRKGFPGSLPGERVWRVFAILYMLLLVLALPAGAQTLRGPARVVDGDTLEVAGEKVRLHGIDAPELAQTCARANGAAWHCGWTAALRLEEVIGGRPVRCLGAERDRYGRLIARCYVVGQTGPTLDLGGALVVRGLAVAYRRYSLDYAGTEATARAARAGIWAGTFVQPEEWRRGGGR